MRIRHWLCVLCVLCGSSSSAWADPDLELVARIDAAVTKAARFLASKQSPDGAWRSDVYAPFKEGDALTPLVLTAILPLPMDATTSACRDSGLDFLNQQARRTFAAPDGVATLAYPLYTAANATIALHQWRRAEDDTARNEWLQLVRALQLTAAQSWTDEDPQFGGWGYGHKSPRKPLKHQRLGPLDEPNLSATTFAITALAVANHAQDRQRVAEGMKFVRVLHNFHSRQDPVPLLIPPSLGNIRIDVTGGFRFVLFDPVRNKAGNYLSYGSATADGLRCMLYGGLPQQEEHRAVTLQWLQKHFSATEHPGDFSVDRAAAKNGLYYYYCASVAQAFRQANVVYLDPKKLDAWAPKLAQALLERQREDGSWKNDAVDQREDDPLVATVFAVQALTACRAMKPHSAEIVAAPAEEGGILCHARDAKCHGEKLQYESLPQKNTLGYWVNEKDWASWRIDVEKPGSFEVLVWQGCGAGQEGSELAIGVGDQSVQFTVEDTGHFQQFKKRSVGKLKLEAGLQELTLKCQHKAKSAVADVRQIHLVPMAMQNRQ